ncbi:uncharacterized protein LOC134339972 isoform X2 [Mobula hypostoma]
MKDRHRARNESWKKEMEMTGKFLSTSGQEQKSGISDRRMIVACDMNISKTATECNRGTIEKSPIGNESARTKFQNKETVEDNVGKAKARLIKDEHCAGNETRRNRMEITNKDLATSVQEDIPGTSERSLTLEGKGHHATGSEPEGRLSESITLQTIETKEETEGKAQKVPAEDDHRGDIEGTARTTGDKPTELEADNKQQGASGNETSTGKGLNTETEENNADYTKRDPVDIRNCAGNESEKNLREDMGNDRAAYRQEENTRTSEEERMREEGKGHHATGSEPEGSLSESITLQTIETKEETVGKAQKVPTEEDYRGDNEGTVRTTREITTEQESDIKQQRASGKETSTGKGLNTETAENTGDYTKGEPAEVRNCAGNESEKDILEVMGNDPTASRQEEITRTPEEERMKGEGKRHHATASEPEGSLSESITLQTIETKEETEGKAQKVPTEEDYRGDNEEGNGHHASGSEPEGCLSESITLQTIESKEETVGKAQKVPAEDDHRGDNEGTVRTTREIATVQETDIKQQRASGNETSTGKGLNTETAENTGDYTEGEPAEVRNCAGNESEKDLLEVMGNDPTASRQEEITRTPEEERMRGGRKRAPCHWK